MANTNRRKGSMNPYKLTERTRNPQAFAKELVQMHAFKKAYSIAEENAKASRMLMGMSDVPPFNEEAEIYEEFYKDKDGIERKRDKIKLKPNVQARRLKGNTAFWENVFAVLRKMKTVQ